MQICRHGNLHDKHASFLGGFIVLQCFETSIYNQGAQMNTLAGVLLM